MTRIEIAAEVLEDFDRFIDHLSSFGIEDIEQRLAEIVDAIDVLSHSPMIGRPVKSGRRELLIGRGSRAYVALYQYLVSIDTVVVLALRSQREAGFSRAGKGPGLPH